MTASEINRLVAGQERDRRDERNYMILGMIQKNTRRYFIIVKVVSDCGCRPVMCITLEKTSYIKHGFGTYCCIMTGHETRNY